MYFIIPPIYLGNLFLNQIYLYQKIIELPQNLIVTVLTPQTFVKMFDHGYVPNFHSSASLKII